MPGQGRRINIFLNPYQEEFIIRRSAEEQIQRKRTLTPSQYVLELISRDMNERGYPKDADEAGQWEKKEEKTLKLRLPKSL